MDIALEGSTVKLHTLVTYPTGTAKAGVVIVMQHGVGLDEWQRALAGLSEGHQTTLGAYHRSWQ